MSTNEALLAAQSDEWSRALDLLLALWRGRPASSLAQAIDQVGKRAAESVPAIVARNDGERHAAWWNRMPDADATTIGAICAEPLEADRPGEMVRRLHALVAKGPDPRVTMRVLDVFELPNLSMMWTHLQPFWIEMWKLLLRLRDPNTAVRVRAFRWLWHDLSEAEQFARSEQLSEREDQILAAYPGPPAFEDAGMLATLIGLAHARSPEALRRQERAAILLAAIAAAPDDEGPRLVYADFLLETTRGR